MVFVPTGTFAPVKASVGKVIEPPKSVVLGRLKAELILSMMFALVVVVGLLVDEDDEEDEVVEDEEEVVVEVVVGVDVVVELDFVTLTDGDGLLIAAIALCS